MITSKPVNKIKSKVHPHGELFLFIKSIQKQKRVKNQKVVTFQHSPSTY